jgi:4-methyl-5(b-hydroxyethyl)-thiazole monophosphate biosynthesis
MIFPGGMPGSKNLAQHAELMEILQDHWSRGGTVAAICAAPGLVVSQLPGLQGRKFTCFDGFQDSLIEKGALYTPESTVTDGQLITGRGAGHAVAFGLAILSALKGKEAADKVKEGLML